LTRAAPASFVSGDRKKEGVFPLWSVLENVSIGYDGRAVLKRLNLRIDMDDRIALLGANGNGNTTVTSFDAQGVATTPTKSTATLGLQDGKVYEIAVFQAERQANSVAFELTMPAFNTAPSECNPI